MPKVKIELNQSGIISLFKSAEVQSYIQGVGEKVASQATGMSGGKAYAARTDSASFTAITNVFPDSPEAAHDNFKNNTLLKVAGSMGLPSSKPHL